MNHHCGQSCLHKYTYICIDAQFPHLLQHKHCNISPTVPSTNSRSDHLQATMQQWVWQPNTTITHVNHRLFSVYYNQNQFSVQIPSMYENRSVAKQSLTGRLQGPDTPLHRHVSGTFKWPYCFVNFLSAWQIILCIPATDVWNAFSFFLLD